MKNKKIILIGIFFVFILLIFNNTSFAKDLDQINKYYITVDPRKDGTLDMVYHVEWEVLDSTSEGPLTWVIIGIPNSNVDSIKSSSSTVKSIKYYEENGDSYIRIDFKKSYVAGETVTFDFSFHQKNMYELKSSYCTYSYTPGWFNSLAVKDIRVYWNAENVYSSNAEETNSDNYLVWTGKLSKGGKLKITVKYEKSAFSSLSSDGQSSYAEVSYSESSTDTSSAVSGINGIIILTVVVVIIYVFISLLGGGYYSHGGYGYGYRDDYGMWGRGHHHHSSSFGRSHSSGGSRGSSCVSSCACACACAGGGRAGCSKKDFYGTNLKTKNIKNVLKN